jgi:hypothetical protein
MRADFRLKLPPGRELYLLDLNQEYNRFQADTRPQKKISADGTTYTWQFKDIPQIIPEASMPPEVEINPTVILSTFKDWQDIYRWWWALAADKIQADQAIKDKVRELTRGQKDSADKARIIYNFCAKEIRYVAVEYGDAGYEPHRAADIYRNKYGDCKDKAILLVTMLKEAGLRAAPVLIPTRGAYNLKRDFPSLLFDHCIGALFLEDKTIFMDTTAETCSFGDLPAADEGRGVLVCKEGGFQILETSVSAAGHNLNKQLLKINFSADESISARKEIFTDGLYRQAQRYWLLYTPPQLIEEALKEKIQGASIGATLISYQAKNAQDLDKPVEFSYAFKGPEYLTPAGDLRIMPQLSAVDTSLVAKESRRYPIDFGTLDRKETYLEIDLGESYAVKYLPQSLSEDSPWLSLQVEYQSRPGRILFKEITQSKKSSVSLEEYGRFKAFLESLAKRLKQRIILEKVR